MTAMVGNVRQLLKPPVRELGKDDAFSGNLGRQDVIKRTYPITRYDEKSISSLY